MNSKTTHATHNRAKETGVNIQTHNLYILSCWTFYSRDGGAARRSNLLPAAAAKTSESRFYMCWCVPKNIYIFFFIVYFACKEIQVQLWWIYVFFLFDREWSELGFCSWENEQEKKMYFGKTPCHHVMNSFKKWV